MVFMMAGVVSIGGSTSSLMTLKMMKRFLVLP